MNLLNHTLTAGKKALDQWRPALEAAVSPGMKDAFGKNFRFSKDDSLPEDWPPPLSKALEEIRGLALPSVLLGIGEDRLPFHLDLTNPASGAVLVCGDARAGAGILMRSMLASAAALNSAQRLSISVIARYVDDYLELAETESCHEVIPVDEDIAGELIEELADLTDARRNGKPTEPILLLAIDDLAECLDFLSESAYARLYRLIRHGPRYGVWTFAALPAERLNRVGSRFLSAFRTRLIGHIQDRRTAAEAALDRAMQAGHLRSGEFFLPYGSEWLRFWACPADKVGAPADE